LTTCWISLSSCSQLLTDELAVTRQNILSSKFEAQMGKMRPVEGRVDSYIGRPIRSETTKNTSCCFCENTQTFFSDDVIVALAVADGEVEKVRTTEQTKFQGVVIVRHGSYITVYRNLDIIFVKEGDRVSYKSPVGEAGLNYHGTHKEFLFDLYAEDSEWLNPKEWVLD